MKISNLGSFKRQVRTGLPIFLVTVGIILIVSSVISFWNGSIDYRVQLEQKDWPITNATVSFVEEKFEFMKTGKTSYRTTNYDIHYEYIVDGRNYTGIIENRIQSKSIGTSLNIKYNPNMPEKSTDILEPNCGFLMSGSILGGIGIIIFVLTLVLLRKNSKLNTGK